MRFTPHKQDKLYNEKAGVRGNCFQTAVACFLEIAINQVPNVEVLFDIPGHEDMWLNVMNTWLQNQGYIHRTADEFKCFHLKTNEEKAMWLGRYGRAHTQDQYELSNMIYFVVGKSPRGVSHIVLYMNGKMIHDPHPSNDGLIPVEDELRSWYFEVIEKLH